MPHSSAEDLLEDILDADIPPIGSVWKHYKGQLYVICGSVILESSEEIAATYKSKDAPLSIPWCRPLKEWYEKVEHKGQLVQRFQKV